MLFEIEIKCLKLHFYMPNWHKDINDPEDSKIFGYQYFTILQGVTKRMATPFKQNWNCL